MSKDKNFPRPGIAIRLAESGGKVDSNKIQIMKAGQYNHMWYGEFVINEALMIGMVSNWNAKTYGIDSMIDYDHECGEAAAWIKSLYMSPDNQELWAEVDWTPPGKQCIDDKTYRYISADFTTNFVNNETGADHGPVLFGAALTNRPFIKGMAPTTELNDLTGGMQMTLQELQAANTKLADQVKAIQSEKDSEVKRLTDESKAKDVQVKTLSDKVVALELDSAKAKKESEFAVLLAEKKVVPAQKDAFISGDMTAFLANAGKLNLKEEGHGKGTDAGGAEGGESDDDKLLKLAEAKFETKKFATMGDAISAAKRELKVK